MNLPQIFCRHFYTTVSTTTQTVRRAAYPKVQHDYEPLAGKQLYVTKNVPVEFYDAAETTEVWRCAKCGHSKIVKH